MKQLFFILTTILTFPLVAQQSITLEECYDLVSKNHPLTAQTGLLNSQHLLDKQVVQKNNLPQLDAAAQATYQSDVIEIPIANANITPLNKDQYKATLSINQLIYSGGVTKSSLALQASQLNSKQKQVEVSLYQLKYQINQLYFSILLVQESKLLVKAKEAQLLARIKEVKSGVKNGILLPASDKILDVELLKVKQQLIEIDSNKQSLIETLSSIVGQELETSTAFVNPLIQNQWSTQLNRPELELFEFKKQEILSSENLLATKNTPKIYGFATSGYGNPGLNMLDNSFQTYYMLGVKLSWKMFDWLANKKKQESLAINSKIIENEKTVFQLNTNIELNKQQQEVDKITSFIESDLEIITLRKEVLQTANSQLKNGTITSSAYITELTNLYEDENTLIKHQIELQLAKANYNVIKGY